MNNRPLSWEEKEPFKVDSRLKKGRRIKKVFLVFFLVVVTVWAYLFT